jgi:hypothetical protein
VKLHEIETLQSRIFQTAMRKLSRHDLAGRMPSTWTPLSLAIACLWEESSLRCTAAYQDAREPPDREVFAAALAVDIRGIEKINTQINCCLK